MKRTKNRPKSILCWLEKAILITHEPIEAHVTDFLGEDVTPSKMIKRSFSLFQELVEATNLLNLHSEYVPSLCIYLTETKRMKKWSNKYKWKHIIHHTPPELSIEKKDSMKENSILSRIEYEEYVCPIDLPLPDSIKENCKCTYECFSACFYDGRKLYQEEGYWRRIFVKHFEEGVLRLTK